MNAISSSSLRFIKCLCANDSKKEANYFDGRFVLNQLRSFGLVDTVAIKKIGYTYKYTYPQFVERFRNFLGPHTDNHYQVISNFLKSFDSKIQNQTGFPLWQVGKSKVFLQTSVAKYLDDLSDGKNISDLRKTYEMELQAKEGNLNSIKQKESDAQLKREDEARAAYALQKENEERELYQQKMKQIEEEERLEQQAEQERVQLYLRLKFESEVAARLEEESRKAIEKEKQDAEALQFLQQNFNVSYSEAATDSYEAPPFEKAFHSSNEIIDEDETQLRSDEEERLMLEEQARAEAKEKLEAAQRRHNEERVLKSQNSFSSIGKPESYILSPSKSNSNSKQSSASSFGSFDKKDTYVAKEDDDNNNNLYSEAYWYYGDIQRKEAERLLISCNQNSYMVRNSSIPHCFALSIFSYSKRTMLHLLVQPSKTEKGYQIQDSEDSQVYPTLVDILKSSPVVKGYEMCGKLKSRG